MQLKKSANFLRVPLDVPWPWVKSACCSFVPNWWLGCPHGHLQQVNFTVGERWNCGWLMQTIEAISVLAEALLSSTREGPLLNEGSEGPGTPFHQHFMSLSLKSHENIFCCNHYSDDAIRPWFCSCHDSWAVVACAKSWSDYMITIHMRTKYILARFVLWAPKWFGKWVAAMGSILVGQNSSQPCFLAVFAVLREPPIIMVQCERGAVHTLGLVSRHRSFGDVRWGKGAERQALARAINKIVLHWKHWFIFRPGICPRWHLKESNVCMDLYVP